MSAPTGAGQFVCDTRNGRIGITTDEPRKTTPRIPVMFSGTAYPVLCQLDELERVEVMGKGADRMTTAANQSTRDLAAILASKAHRSATRDTLYAYGAEMATIDSLMLANVGQAVDMVMTELRAEA